MSLARDGLRRHIQHTKSKWEESIRFYKLLLVIQKPLWSKSLRVTPMDFIHMDGVEIKHYHSVL